MKKKFKRSLTILLASLLVASSVILPADAANKKEKKKNYVEGEVIAVLKDNAAKKYQKASKASSAYGAGIKLTGSYTFSANKGNKLKIASLKSDTLSTKDMIIKLRKNKAVRYAFPNYIKKASAVTNDTYSEYQWALENNGQNNGKKGLDTKAKTLWDEAKKSKDEKVVAIIDTGIDYEHEDLEKVVWNNPYGNKLIGKHGFDFTGNIDGGEPYDDNGHGSHCAGIIAGAADNKKGISGINKSGVKIMALKFLDETGSGSDEDALAAFDYVSRAKSLGANVVSVNCSWGGYGSEEEKIMYDELFDELGKQGIITCCAAGNESSNIDVDDMEEDDFWGTYYDTPAASSSRYCLTVAASNGKDKLASFSNYGYNSVDLAAPGTEILSTVSTPCFNPSIYSAKQIEELCLNYADYNDGVDETKFGYPKKMDVSATDDEDDDSEFVDFKVKSSKEFFGTNGKSLEITPNDDGTVCFEMPYTAEENCDYTASFMFSSKSSASGTVYDVPASYTYDDIMDSDDDGFIIIFGKNKGKRSSEYFDCDGEYWTHITLDCNSYDDSEDDDFDDEDYRKAKALSKAKSDDDDDFDDYEDYDDFEDDYEAQPVERKLVFVVDADDTIYFDDIAISTMDVDTDDFGKYDFYNGTSMATPYVTGAIALLSNAYPEASTVELINMARNSNRYSDELEDMVATASVLSLEKNNDLPPLITDIDINDDGLLQIDGSFTDKPSVTINEKKITPVETSSSKILCKDNNYNTNMLTVLMSNKNGEDFFEKLISNKKSYPVATDKIGAPEDTTYGVMVNAGDEAYYIDAYNNAGKLSYDFDKETYVYTDEAFKIDFSGIDRLDGGEGKINSAVYKDGRIYFTAEYDILSGRTGRILGYDSIFGCYDIAEDKVYDFGALDDSMCIGSSVALYKDDIYVIGGMDVNGEDFSDAMYKFNGESLEETSYKLPTARAFTQYIEYDGKLVGIYGATGEYEIPNIIYFNGTKWKNSGVQLSSSDSDTTDVTPMASIEVFTGNVGIDKDGIFCNGAYCFGLGDTFTYNPAEDDAVSSDYSFNNEIGGDRLVGTALPGAFVGFNVLKPVEEYEIILFGKSASKNSFVANDVSSYEVNAFTISLDNGEPQPKTEPVTEPDSTGVQDETTAPETNATAETTAPSTVTTAAAETTAPAAVTPKPVTPATKTPSTPKPAAKKVKKDNTVKVSVKTKSLKAKKLALKTQKVKAIKVKNAVGKVTYKLTSAPKKIKKLVKISKKGVLKFKKGKYAKKTYKIKIRITAKGNNSYNAKTLNKTVKIKVK